MSNNTFNFPTSSVSSNVNFQTCSGTSSNNNAEVRVQYWRSKVVPGLERLLMLCDCGCGLTYDEFGNWSTALQVQSPNPSTTLQSPTGCCSTEQQHGGTVQDHRTEEIYPGNRYNCNETFIKSNNNFVTAEQPSGSINDRSIEELLDSQKVAVYWARRVEAFLWNKKERSSDCQCYTYESCGVSTRRYCKRCTEKLRLKKPPE